ncbi:MAG TPA: M28 family peptidase [Longimicrobiales bacterium]|nr:M28 family peptidase [Longimicrobiales bacterium]
MTSRRLGPVALAVLLPGLAACGDSEVSGPTPGRPSFDGEAALALVREQVAFGPRVPGSEGHARQLEWMVARLDTLSAEVAVDTFTHRTAAGESLTLFNVLARFRPEATRRILLLAHWDTRPRSDAAADPALRDTPVPGANDGASGTAVLLVLAELLSRDPPPMGVDLLFTDGEDYGPGVEDMLLGARRYASELPGTGRPVYGLLLDMVGDADASFPPEEISLQRASVVVRKVQRAAERLGYGAYFPDRVGPRLVDDHVPLLDAGLATANLVDFSYGPGNSYWHTPDDTPERLSAATLEIVGEVVAELIYSGG